MTYKRVARDPAARWRYCVDGVVVMGAAAAEPMFLETPGDVIWRLLEMPRTLAELADELQRRFTGDRATIVRDVEAFVAELTVAGLVER